MNEKKGIMQKLQDYLMPVGNFLANERHFAAISGGLMATVGVTMVGAVFTILKSPPVTEQIMKDGGILKTLFGWWYNLVQQYGDILQIPVNFTTDMIGLVAVFAIAYNLAKSYKMSAFSNGITAVLMFLMVVAPFQAIPVEGGMAYTVLPTAWLGAAGLFTGIIIALVSVEITHICVKNNWVVRMPDVVPQFLQDSFSSMIPLLLNIIVFLGINTILGSYSSGLDIPTAINDVFKAPLSAVNSVPGMIIVMVFASLLWLVGVHGTMIVYPILMPLMIGAIMQNAQLVAAGQDPVFSPMMLFGAIGMVGGTGNTMGLSILCATRAKSEQLKAIGKVSWVPGIFGVNEPVIFGAPIVFNPILAIPFIFSTIIIAFIMWLGYQTGILVPTYILIMALMPIGVGSGLGSMSLINFLFGWLMIPVSAIIYYPFFKIYDASLVKSEADKKTAEG